MASLSYHTKNPSRGKPPEARVLPAALRENQAYKKAYEDRIIAHHDLHNAIGALNSARNQIKSHENYHKQSSDQHQGSLYTPLTDAALENLDKKIAEEKKIINEEHGKFAAAHEKMRDIEKINNVPDAQRLARTYESNPVKRGTMYGKHGIHNIQNRSHISQHDQMESVKSSPHQYMKGGRRKKTRKKRRRKNKRKTKRRKKTRRRKKRRKKRRTKRR